LAFAYTARDTVCLGLEKDEDPVGKNGKEENPLQDKNGTRKSDDCLIVAHQFLLVRSWASIFGVELISQGFDGVCRILLRDAVGGDGEDEEKEKGGLGNDSQNLGVTPGVRAAAPAKYEAIAEFDEGDQKDTIG
jgi:hypothetical protein